MEGSYNGAYPDGFGHGAPGVMAGQGMMGPPIVPAPMMGAAMGQMLMPAPGMVVSRTHNDGLFSIVVVDVRLWM